MSGDGPTVTLFGGFSNFTWSALKCLIENRLNLEHLVISAYGPDHDDGALPPDALFQSKSPEMVALCEQQGISVTYTQQSDTCAGTILSEHPSDIFLLACYPRFLPGDIARIPAIDCINIHPSILPKYRGSNPIFWQLHNGETETGVTLHQVADNIDGGDIIAARKVRYPEGIGIDMIEDLLVCAAVEMLRSLFCRNPTEWDVQPQDEILATRQPSPCDKDLVLDSMLPVRIAWNLIRAYAKSELTLKYSDRSRIHWISDAIEFGSRGQSNYSPSNDTTVIAHFVDGYVVLAIEKSEPII